MFEAPPTNPQSVGDIIGRGCRLLRQNATLLVREQIMPCVVMVVGQVLLQFGASYGLKQAPTNLTMAILTIVSLCIGGVITIVGFWFLTINQFAFVRLASGLNENYADARKFAGKKKWTIIALFFVVYVFAVFIVMFWLLLGLAIAIIGSKMIAVAISGVVLGTLGLIASAGLLSVYYFVTNAALATEDEKLTSILRRVVRLVTRDFWRACGFAMLLSILLSILSYTLSLPIVALAMFEVFRSGITHSADPATAIPFYVLVISQFWQALINMFLLPISFMSAGLFYRDLKVRQEGFDVLQRLSKLSITGA